MLKLVVVLATVAGPPVGGSGPAVSLLLLLVLLLFCLLRYCCCFWSLIMVLLLLLLLCLVTVCMCLVALGVKKICSTSHPGGNQVDGLPPASSFACQKFEFEKSARSFDSVVNFLPSLCYFAADCMVEWPKLCIGHEVNYRRKFSCGIKFS